MEPKVPIPPILKLPKGLLIKQACKHHNRWQKEKAARLDDLFAEVQYVSPQSPEAVIERVVINYLRYQCEQKQPILAQLQGQPEHFETYKNVRHQILMAIAQTYPWLATGCERQSFL